MQKILQNGSIGKNIQRIRKAKGMTQDDVVRELQLYGRGISIAHFGHIEQGRKNIRDIDLVLLHKIFQVNYEEFFAGIELKR